ncbi:conserved hypothetical protein [Vibrio phage 141O35-1]|nr:conserved hypothetical protein [Vibrio phage 141O35-1]CAH9015989.1 conserved hypothetical protein [Vibrio phage 141E35-1]
MRISELIKELQETLDSDGDLEVRLQTDHGQCVMRATWAGVGYIEDDSYMPEAVADEDRDESHIKVCEIQAF